MIFVFNNQSEQTISNELLYYVKKMYTFGCEIQFYRAWVRSLHIIVGKVTASHNELRFVAVLSL